MDHRMAYRNIEECDARRKEEVTRQLRVQTMFKGNTFPITGQHSSTDETRVTRFIIDTPRDNGMHRRDDLWSFQKGNRGIQVNKGDSLPAIPYRLGSRGQATDSPLGETDSIQEIRNENADARLTDYWHFQKEGVLPRLNHYHHQQQHCSNKNNNNSNNNHSESGRDRSKHMHPLLHLGTPVEVTNSRLTSNNNGGLFITEDPKLAISQKIHLTERDQKSSDKPAVVPLSERIPRTITKAKTFVTLQIKRSASSLDLQKQQVVVESPIESPVCPDIPSDRIGPTTKYKSMEDTPRTLADLINKESNDRYRNLTNKRQRLAGKVFSQNIKSFPNENVSTREVDLQLCEKFHTRLIDGFSYDTFARTRRLVPEQLDIPKESIDKKRLLKTSPLDQNSWDFSEGFSTLLKDGSQLQKVDSLQGKTQKHSKLRIVLSNNRVEL